MTIPECKFAHTVASLSERTWKEASGGFSGEGRELLEFDRVLVLRSRPPLPDLLLRSHLPRIGRKQS